MSEKSGKTRWAEPVMLGLAVALVSLGMTGLGKALFGGEAAWTESWRSNLLLAGVVLAVGTLAASAYRSRSQIDIDRLEQAAQELRKGLSLEEAKNLRAVFQAANAQAAEIARSIDAMKTEVAQVGENARQATASQDSIRQMSIEMRSELKSVSDDRRKLRGGMAARLLSAWETNTAVAIPAEQDRCAARYAYYEEIKALLLSEEDDLRPKPTNKGWESADGEFELVPSSRPEGDIVLVTKYACLSAGKQSNGIVGKKSLGPESSPVKMVPGPAADSKDEVEDATDKASEENISLNVNKGQS